MTKLVAVSLVERPQYGACEFKDQIQVNTRKGTIFSVVLLGILLGIYLIVISQDEEFIAPVIVPIGSLILEAIDNSEDENEDKMDAAPEVEDLIQHGPAARAGTPMAVPDAEITPDMQDFADMDVLDRASAIGGDGLDLGDMADNIEFEEVQIKKPIEVVPKYDDFVVYEKEAKWSSMADLQKLVVYPKLALQAGIGGTVNVKVYITKAGKPTRVGIVTSDNQVLNKAAMDAVKRYKGYVPASQDGKPAGMWLTIPIKFVQY